MWDRRRGDLVWGIHTWDEVCGIQDCDYGRQTVVCWGIADESWQANECMGELGGVANITRLTAEEVEKARAENARIERELRQAGTLGDGNEKVGMADKGKAMLLGKRE